ncbi:MAG: hypothetical protein HQL21_07280, partial [Candidatus Omnitrophica bacterium]|nr:hypothetical protein [Candidatus Omnitrophota bacterium]
SPVFTTAYLKAMVINPADPFKFDFVIYRGDEPLTQEQKQAEYTKLIKYFLASLAVPDTDQWVNLSPYEKDRIIPDGFGMTEMGRDLLAQDYLLKQISSSLTNPDTDLGKKFWDGVYDQAYQKFGTTEIQSDTFNKVWIIPDKVVIYERGNMVYVLEQHLKVMLEKDYLATKENRPDMTTTEENEATAISRKVMLEVIIPAIEKEVNEGKNFAPLRQVYSGMLLAAWYKRALKESILSKLYTDKGKGKGVDQDPKSNKEIYGQYVEAFKKGVFNMIKEDVDRFTQEVIPRKYFSGGTVGTGAAQDANPAMVQRVEKAMAQRDFSKSGSENFDLANSAMKNSSEAPYAVKGIRAVKNFVLSVPAIAKRSVRMRFPLKAMIGLLSVMFIQQALAINPAAEKWMRDDAAKNNLISGQASGIVEHINKNAVDARLKVIFGNYIKANGGVAVPNDLKMTILPGLLNDPQLYASTDDPYAVQKAVLSKAFSETIASGDREKLSILIKEHVRWIQEVLLSAQKYVAERGKMRHAVFDDEYNCSSASQMTALIADDMGNTYVQVIEVLKDEKGNTYDSAKQKGHVGNLLILPDGMVFFADQRVVGSISKEGVEEGRFPQLIRVRAPDGKVYTVHPRELLKHPEWRGNTVKDLMRGNGFWWDYLTVKKLFDSLDIDEATRNSEKVISDLLNAETKLKDMAADPEVIWHQDLSQNVINLLQAMRETMKSIKSGKAAGTILTEMTDIDADIDKAKAAFAAAKDKDGFEKAAYWYGKAASRAHSAYERFNGRLPDLSGVSLNGQPANAADILKAIQAMEQNSLDNQKVALGNAAGVGLQTNAENVLQQFQSFEKRLIDLLNTAAEQNSKGQGQDALVTRGIITMMKAGEWELLKPKIAGLTGLRDASNNPVNPQTIIDNIEKLFQKAVPSNRGNQGAGAMNMPNLDGMDTRLALLPSVYTQDTTEKYEAAMTANYMDFVGVLPNAADRPRVVESILLGELMRGGEEEILEFAIGVNLSYVTHFDDGIKKRIGEVGLDQVREEEAEKMRAAYKSMSDVDKAKFLGQNMAAPRGLAAAVRSLTVDPEDGNRSIEQLLNRLSEMKDGQYVIPSDDPIMVAIANSLNATWASVLWLRGFDQGLKRSQGPMAGDWQSLDFDTKDKDYVLARDMAKFSADKLEKLRAKYMGQDPQDVAGYADATVRKGLEARVKALVNKMADSQNQERLRKALYTSMFVHRHVKRDDGQEPYFAHILDAVEALSEIFPDADVLSYVIAAYHDTREDEPGTYAQIKNYVAQNIRTKEAFVSSLERHIDRLKEQEAKNREAIARETARLQIIRASLAADQTRGAQLRLASRILSNQYDMNQERYVSGIAKARADIDADLKKYGAENMDEKDLQRLANYVFYLRAVRAPRKIWIPENAWYDDYYVRINQGVKLADILANLRSMKNLVGKPEAAFSWRMNKLRVTILELFVERPEEDKLMLTADEKKHFRAGVMKELEGYENSSSDETLATEAGKLKNWIDTNWEISKITGESIQVPGWVKDAGDNAVGVVVEEGGSNVVSPEKEAAMTAFPEEVSRELFNYEETPFEVAVRTDIVNQLVQGMSGEMPLVKKQMLAVFVLSGYENALTMPGKLKDRQRAAANNFLDSKRLFNEPSSISIDPKKEIGRIDAWEDIFKFTASFAAKRMLKLPQINLDMRDGANREVLLALLSQVVVELGKIRTPVEYKGRESAWEKILVSLAGAYREYLKEGKGHFWALEASINSIKVESQDAAILRDNISHITPVSLRDDGIVSRLALTYSGVGDYTMPDSEIGGPAMKKEYGGIDLNAANLDMQIKRDGKGVPLPVSQQDLENIKIDGLVPVILNIQPAASVPLFSEVESTSPVAA